ncbi:MAG TPA: sulfur carrier protein ThiS [Nannocystis exedens]|nr:sulfur carrier protein ThiS [Nannocystis exedens]
MPTIVLNGERHELSAPMTVTEVITSLGLDARQVAVERNREIVTRAEHSKVIVVDGDQLEIVTFVGGG